MLEMMFSTAHECHTADCAEKALEFLEVQRYDAVITDVSMPGLGGVEILRRINERHTDTPVIVISGRPDQYQETAIELGAFAFFGKPFSLLEIEASVNNAIKESSPAA